MSGLTDRYKWTAREQATTSLEEKQTKNISSEPRSFPLIWPAGGANTPVWKHRWAHWEVISQSVWSEALQLSAAPVSWSQTVPGRSAPSCLHVFLHACCAKLQLIWACWVSQFISRPKWNHYSVTHHISMNLLCSANHTCVPRPVHKAQQATRQGGATAESGKEQQAFAASYITMTYILVV